jgi:GMP synthase-like glutamine amidotransferase
LSPKNIKNQQLQTSNFKLQTNTMKIGLLECDHVAEEFSHISGTYPEMFKVLLPEIEFAVFDVCNGKFPDSIDECEAYICTGSRQSVYENIEWIKQLKDFVFQLHKNQKLFVGICFGHQILAEALGGKVLKSEGGWNVGVHEFEMISKENRMTPFQPKFNLLMMCQDQVVEMPENSRLLAQSKDCSIAMFSVGESMLGIQAHPEFSKKYEKALMLDRIDRVGEFRVQKALESLEKSIDKDLIATWIFNFINA